MKSKTISVMAIGHLLRKEYLYDGRFPRLGGRVGARRGYQLHTQILASI